MVVQKIHRADTRISELKQFVVAATFTDSRDALIRIAHFVNLDCQVLSVVKPLSTGVQFPIIAQLSHRDEFVVIVKRIEGRFLLHKPGTDEPQWVDKQALNEMAFAFAYRLSPLAGSDTEGRSKVLQNIFKSKRLFLDIFLASLFIQVLALSGPIFFQTIIDKVIQHQSVSTLDVLAVGLLIAIAFEVLLTSVRNILTARAGANIDMALGKDYFSHLIRLPKVYFDKTSTGKQVSNVKDLERLRDLLTGSSINLHVDVVFSVLFLAVIFYYSSTLGLVVCAFIPCYAFLAMIFSRLLQPKIREKHQQSEQLEDFLIDSFSGIETVKTRCAEPQLEKQWSRHLHQQIATNQQLGKLENLYKQISLTLNKLSGLAILYFGATQVLDNALTMGQFIAVNLLTQRLLAPIERVSRSMGSLGEIKALIAKISSLLSLECEQVGRSGLIKSGRSVSGEIRIEHAEFGYAADTLLFKKMNLNIKANQAVGIVAPSGKGKSTLIKLLMGLYPLKSGNIYLDDMNIHSVSMDWYRQQIALVNQTPYLFNLSVLENIALNNRQATYSDIVRVARLVGIDELINGLPQGYHTHLQREGIVLSVEQMQAIAIARALLLEAKVLIFDEVLSTVGPKTRQALAANIHQLKKTKTLIFTSSHPGQLLDMDLVFEIKDRQLLPLHLRPGRSPRAIKLHTRHGVRKELS